MKIIKVLPSVYRGVTYRSRMEARWAVFMDHAGVPFIYEPEGYDLGGGLCYIPDFYLRGMDAFLEIKNPLDKESLKKPEVLSGESGRRVFVFLSNPKYPESPGFDWESDAAIFYSDGHWSDSGYLWCECEGCRKVDLQFEGRSDRIDCRCKKSEHGDKGYNSETDRLRKAFEISAAWRFE